MFKLILSADTIGVTTMGEVEVAPARLVRQFGPPAQSDGYKISGEYVFIDEAGQPFVVHDFKSTNLWESDLQSPSEFWTSEEPQEFCIATRDVDTAAFQAWLMKELA